MESGLPNKQLALLRGSLYFKALEPVFEGLEGINYAVIKGEALSIQAFGSAGCRNYGDVDILIDRGNLPLLDKILTDNGFSQPQTENLSRYDRIYMSLSHQTRPYTKQTQSISVKVDVNVDLFWGEYNGERTSVDELLADAEPMSIYRSTVKTLPIPKAFVQLCLHHYKEFNSFDHITRHNPLKRQAFADVYYLIKNNPPLTAELVAELSERYKITPYVFYVLYYTAAVFGDGLLNGHLSALRTPVGEALLNKYGLSDKERKEWKVDFETRYRAESLYPLFRGDLTREDTEKISRHNRIFN